LFIRLSAKSEEMNEKNVNDADQLAIKIIEALKINQPILVIDLEVQIISAAQERPELLCKAYGWIAQAYILLNEGDKAMKSASKAIGLARSLFDHKGMKILQDLRSKAIAISKAKNAYLPTDKSTIAQANEALTSGDNAKAKTLAHQAIAEADEKNNPRDQIISRLLLARMGENQEKILMEALSIADRSSDKNLVTAVKKAMDSIGYHVKEHIF